MLDNNNSALAINSSTSIPTAAFRVPFKYTDLSTTTASNASSQARGIEGSSPPDFKNLIDHNDTKRVVSPNIFIAGWEIECPSARWIVGNMDPSWRNYPRFRTGPQLNQIGGRSRPEYINHISELENMSHNAKELLYRRIRNHLLRCRTCTCDQETGELKPGGQPPTGSAKSHTWCLRGTEVPESCRSWWNCYCKVTARQPPLVEGESYEAHLNALERLPQAFRDQVPDYQWAPPGTTINVRPLWLGEAPPPFAPLPELEPGVSPGLIPVASPELGPALEEPPELVDMDQLEMLLLDTTAIPYARQRTPEEPSGEPDGESGGESGGESDEESIVESSAGPSRGPTLYGAHDRQGWRQPRRYYDPVRGFDRPPGGGSAPPPLLRRRDNSLKKREISMPNQAGNAEMDETTNAQ
ncbi:hypothetical protein AOL_s00110g270 [Orbilia oligospora ATCC 24927]|uniref:Uncharacterized protein n=1 Tax=Arthrobotrys oligospora (strain ATCC 24927 / CBS 115.81 / DSM 1491) TaxID=756982 RepID=G1XLA0_ARTOA|nr:hypothetical protein AOL_s00110g270 [Orbilia oligospora ATCC 24927]EGX46106.1 hypothetical protein AOL_s00110g270 [Orbilia oligospora ATCC 24927]